MAGSGDQVLQRQRPGVGHQHLAEAGIDAKGASVKRTASFRWSKTTSESTELTKEHDESTTLPLKENQWGRLDIRMCAGLYAGYVAYRGIGDDSGKFGIYPMLAPVHVPGLGSRRGSPTTHHNGGGT
ncbi:hypothetical protein [Streptomyces microflavus]|uniref:hypothetical protein n=1 Tax=Streptomyces microflavus TaxID=1919 RepID=UPI0036E5E19F